MPNKFAQLIANKQRQKQFPGLIRGEIYYIYYYAGNASGVSPVSEPVDMMWRKYGYMG